jgi:hypothetical protein
MKKKILFGSFLSALIAINLFFSTGTSHSDLSLNQIFNFSQANAEYEVPPLYPCTTVLTDVGSSSSGCASYIWGTNSCVYGISGSCSYGYFKNYIDCYGNITHITESHKANC